MAFHSSPVIYFHPQNLKTFTTNIIGRQVPFLARLAEFVLTLNIFFFEGAHYQQISSVTMRTKMGRSYANLFPGFVEKQIFEQYADTIPDYFGRYIDDCCSSASCFTGDMEEFINYVNHSNSDQ